MYTTPHSLTHLAQVSGLSVSGASLVMSGRHAASPVYAHKLAEALKCSVLFFLAPGWYDLAGQRLAVSDVPRKWKYSEMSAELRAQLEELNK